MTLIHRNCVNPKPPGDKSASPMPPWPLFCRTDANWCLAHLTVDMAAAPAAGATNFTGVSKVWQVRISALGTTWKGALVADLPMFYHWCIYAPQPIMHFGTIYRQSPKRGKCLHLEKKIWNMLLGRRNFPGLAINAQGWSRSTTGTEHNFSFSLFRGV